MRGSRYQEQKVYFTIFRSAPWHYLSRFSRSVKDSSGPTFWLSSLSVTVMQLLIWATLQHKSHEAVREVNKPDRVKLLFLSEHTGNVKNNLIRKSLQRRAFVQTSSLLLPNQKKQDGDDCNAKLEALKYSKVGSHQHVTSYILLLLLCWVTCYISGCFRVLFIMLNSNNSGQTYLNSVTFAK